MKGMIVDELVLTRNDDVPNDPFRFSVSDNEIVLANIGDFGATGSSSAAVADMVHSWQPNAILTNGNNSYDVLDYGSPIDTIYSAFVDRDIMLPCPGSQDWLLNDLDDYLDYFEDVTNRRYYYKRIIGPVCVFMMDSNSVTPDGNGVSSYQASWLAAELTASQSPWNIVVLHHPPYSNDDADGSSTDSRWDFTGADIVISGHAHNYQRNLVSGIHYIVNGLGGVLPPIDGFDAEESWTVENYNERYGAGKIIATPNKLIWRFLAPNDDLETELPVYESFSFYDTFETYEINAEPDADGVGFSGGWAYLDTINQTVVVHEMFDYTTTESLDGKTADVGLGVWS